MPVTLKYIAWALMACQLIAWAWMQIRGGSLRDRQYFVFCLGMMLGQIGASIECIMKQSWGTLIVQVYFFIFTLSGGIIRFFQMRRQKVVTR